MWHMYLGIAGVHVYAYSWGLLRARKTAIACENGDATLE